MIAIIESGATSADWAFFDKSTIYHQFETIGYNPLSTKVDTFLKSFEANKPDQLGEVSHIYFYGAGCSSPKAISLATATIKKLFPESQIAISNDLYAAARAVSQSKPSLICLLGTGSNSCLYNGHKIIDQVPNLGYLLGDEGAGFSIGKALLKAYFYRELPANLMVDFQDKYQLTRDKLIDTIYSSSAPNRDIAAFARFAVEAKDHSFIQSMISDVFDEFVQKVILKYQLAPNTPIHFVGTIGYIFQNRMEQILERNHLVPGQFVKKPINNLIEYHRELG